MPVLRGQGCQCSDRWEQSNDINRKAPTSMCSVAEQRPFSLLSHTQLSCMICLITQGRQGVKVALGDSQRRSGKVLRDVRRCPPQYIIILYSFISIRCRSPTETAPWCTFISLRVGLWRAPLSHHTWCWWVWPDGLWLAVVAASDRRCQGD